MSTSRAAPSPSSHAALSTTAQPAQPAAKDGDSSTSDDSFKLYDLKVEVICPPGERIMCGAQHGDSFALEGEMLRLPPGQGFSIYSLGAVLPLLAAKQRFTDAKDWMTTDAEVACPDPNCKSRLRITRTGVRTFRHSDVTVVPLQLTSSGTTAQAAPQQALIGQSVSATAADGKSTN